MVFRSVVAALGAAAVWAMLPGAAGAATRHVDMGAPMPAAQKLQQLSADANAFFPSRTIINVGDRVEFMPYGFHNADLPRRGRGPAPLFVPGADKANVTDALGAPFWFSGQAVFGFNPLLMQPKFGTTATYTGRQSVNSGLPVGPGPPKPFTVRFTRQGTYSFFCDVHPGMRGSVTVRRRGSQAPSAAVHRKRARLQVAAAIRTARALRRTKPAPTTVLVGAAGRGGVESQAFYPARKTVKVGTILRFAMDQGSRDIHTATTGPGDPMNEKDTSSLLNVLAASFQSPQIDPRAFYPSDPPGGPPVGLTPALRGNG